MEPYNKTRRDSC